MPAPSIPNASTWENDLAALLADLSSVQQDLLDSLATKRERMRDQDAAALNAETERELDLANRLQACHSRRQELLERAKGEGLPHDSIRQLARVVAGGDGKLPREAADLSHALRLLQHESLTNFVIAQRTWLHLAQLLEIIATGGRTRPTYSKGSSVYGRGSLVDEAA